MSIRMAIVFWFWLLSMALGQTPAPHRDPTVPSDKIRARMAKPSAIDSVSTGEKVTEKPVELKLRGIVLSDVDHGSAIIEALGRRWMLRLDRAQLGAASLSFMIGNQLYSITDFSALSITIQRDGQEWIVSQR